MTVQDSVAVQALAARLSPDFQLGVASAAFQIEGSLAAGGRGPSGWDAFAEKPGSILDGHSPAVACDHYNRAARRRRADARRSASTPTASPSPGRGSSRTAPDRSTAQGLDFYDRLIDQLLEAGISPMATLYHWDTPLPLEHRGGWMNRSTAERFAEYSAAAGRRFGDRVAQWVTLNEPVSVTLNGYALGVHAPGHDLLFDALPSVHHQLLAHGLAVQALRAEGVTGAVGVTNLHSPVRPASRLGDGQVPGQDLRPGPEPGLRGPDPPGPLPEAAADRQAVVPFAGEDLRRRPAHHPPAPGLLRAELLLPREGRHRTRARATAPRDTRTRC